MSPVILCSLGTAALRENTGDGARRAEIEMLTFWTEVDRMDRISREKKSDGMLDVSEIKQPRRSDRDDSDVDRGEIVNVSVGGYSGWKWQAGGREEEQKRRFMDAVKEDGGAC